MRAWQFRSRALREEMRFHQEQLGAEGLSPQEVTRVFGNELLLRERARDAWGWRWLENRGRDLRLAGRQLRRAPGLTVVILLTLAIGTGATTAVFSVLNANLWRSLPVARPGQLSLLYWTAQHPPRDLDTSGTNDGLPNLGDRGNGHGGGMQELYSMAYPDFVELRRAARPLASATFGFAPLGDPNSTIVVNGSASLGRGSVVTEDYFSGLGLQAARGRILQPSDFQPGAPLAAVISFGYWSAHFARSEGAIGQRLTVDRRPAVIVGVAPRGFEGLERGFADEFWLPAVAGNGLLPWGGYQPPSGSIFASRVYWWLEVMVRRRPGVSQAALVAALAPKFDVLSAGDVRAILRPGDNAPQLRAIPGAHGINDLADAFGASLRVLMAGVALLLLLACVNIAALLLSRASTRRRELGVRLALGAGRARLVAQLLTESLLLALLGGALGLALAPAAAASLNGLLANRYQAPAVASLDWRVFAFALAVALVSGMAFGLAPALRNTRLQLTDAVKSGLEFRHQRLRTDKALAVAQTALSLMLLVGAGLLVRTLMTLEHQPLGFNPNNIVTFDLDARQAGYTATALPGFYLGMQQRLRAIAGVTSVGTSQHTLLGGDAGGDTYRAPTSSNPGAWRDAGRNGIGPGFFTTLGIPVLHGRAVGEGDVRDGSAVADINESMARALFGTKDPLGQLILRRDEGSHATPFTIIGIVGDTRYATLRGNFQPTIYIPYTRLVNLAGLTFELRMVAPPSVVIPEVRRAIQTENPGLALDNVQTQTAQDLTTLGSERLLAKLGSGFALLGLLLAAIGIEGTMAYAVVRRTREIGVRMALGADRRRVAGAIAREALLVAVGGIALGAGLALALGRLIASELYGVVPSDVSTLAGASLVLLLVALGAAWLPARRAAAISPMTALRSE